MASKVRIAFVGDINLGEYYTTFGHGPGTLADNTYLFEAVDDIFQNVDFAVGNLEASICRHGLNSSDPESAVLRVKPQHSKQLKQANFQLLQIANNHTVQHGEDAFAESIAELKKIGVQAVGHNGQQPALVEINNIRLGFLAASDVPDNSNKEQQLYQRMDDAFLDRVTSSVGTVDHLVVMLHWGLEASTEPLPYQIEYASRLKELGVRAIIGSHPHLFYPVECNPSFVCAYSLGNFIFDLPWENRLLKSGILEVTFQKKTIHAKVWPITLSKDGALPVLSGTAKDVNGGLTLYNLGHSMRYQQLKKLSYFFRKLHKGNTLLKLKFITKKLTNLFT
jgi:poly-gamma-glutamate synthesis protein (capsule biosynthesis protein)